MTFVFHNRKRDNNDSNALNVGFDDADKALFQSLDNSNQHFRWDAAGNEIARLDGEGNMSVKSVTVDGVDANDKYALSNAQSNWNYGSNTASWTSNTLPTYALSNGQSNWVFASNTAVAASNTAYWTSNTLPTYALSNGQSNWVFASNTAVAASNTAYWTSNTLPTYALSNGQSNWVFASNTANWTSNTLPTYALSNGQSNWVYASNTAVVASNTAYWSSNAHSNYLLSATASNAYALSNGQSNWNYGSNTASWTSNILPTYALSNGQSNWNYGSNTASWTSNILPTYALSNGQSNWVFASNTAVAASNTAYWTSNTLPTYALSNGQSNWNYGSNTANWTSNILPTYALSNGQSNWVFASNTSVAASNTAYWTSNILPTYALSNGQSNWNYGSNTANWTSNILPTYALSNGQSNWVFASNTSVAASNTTYWTSNILPTYALSNGQSNWVFASNTSVAASNTAYWTSNILPTYALSNGQSNWVFASNTSVAASNTANWTSNILPTYALSNGQSNWNFASNTAYWTSNALPSYLVATTAATTYALSNAQSNWNFASNSKLNLSGGVLTGALYLSNNGVFLRNTGDVNHGLNYSTTFDGPTLFGFAGGALSTKSNSLDVLVWKSTGNVGIGTSTPTEKLNVSGNILLPSQQFIRVGDVRIVDEYNSSVSDRWWKLATLSNINGANVTITGVDCSRVDQDCYYPFVRYRTKSTSNYMPSFQYSRIGGAQGHVNVYTNTSTTNFEVWVKLISYSSFKGCVSIGTSLADDTAPTKNNTWTTSIPEVANTSLVMNFSTASNLPIQYTTINDNVGIGTSNPGYKLDVGGTINASSNVLAQNIGIGTTSPLVPLHVVGKTAIGDGVTSNLAVRALNLISSDASLRIYKTTAGGDPAVELWSANLYKWDFYVSNGDGVFNIRDRTSVDTRRLVINSNGYVGINNTSPAYFVDVGGDINTSSNFRQGGVLISSLYASSNAQSNWVFASNTAYWTSNNLSNYTGGTGGSTVSQSNWDFASNTAYWTSNALPNYLVSTTAATTYALSNAQSNWVFASNTAVVASNTAFWTSNTLPSYLASTTAATTYALSNPQSNWVFASNTAYWGSNAHSNYLLAATASNTYALSNSQSNWVFASNAAVAGSNTAYWTSNTLPNYLASTTAATTYALSNAQSNWVFASNTAVVASNTAFWTSNTLPSYLASTTAATTYALSNAQSNWVFASNTSVAATNTALAASNTAYWTSNALPNYLASTTAASTYALSNAQSNWVFASNTVVPTSNTAYWTSNALPNYLVSTTAATTYALSNAQSNWVFASNTAVVASNTAFWTSNTLPSYLASTTAATTYALSNAQSNWVFASNTSVAATNTALAASNTAYWTSNALPNYLVSTTAAGTYALSNAQSNWVFASNIAVAASNTANYTSNALPTYLLSTTAASTYLTTTNAASTYAQSNSQSNWVFASNTAYWSSNTLSNYALSNGQSNWNWSSNTLSNYAASNGQSNWNWSSNTLSNYAASNGQSNWNWSSNTLSNYALSNGQSNWNWSSNTLFNYLLLSTASNAYAASNGQSNWNWSSNTLSNYLLLSTASNAYAASNGQSNWNWSSNTLSNYLLLSTASNAYAASNAQSNWNWSSNTLSNYLLLSTASNAYAASNGQSNWNWGSNTAVAASNAAYWTSNNKLNLSGGQMSGALYMNQNAVYVKTSPDSNHGLSYSATYDGPTLFGFSGGALIARQNSVAADVVALVWKSSGNVGIGTSSPSYLLDVNGTAQIAPSTYQNIPLRVLNSTQSNNNNFIVFGKAVTNYNSAWVNFQHLGTDGAQSNYLSLGVFGLGTTLAPLNINGYGLVGIGCNTPTYNLDINGTCGVASNMFFGSTTRQMINLYGTQFAIGVQMFTTYFRTAYDFQFYKGGVHSDTRGDPGTLGTALMTIKDTGNVGIGTTSPGYTLDVTGTARVSSNLFFGSTARQMINLYGTAHAIGVQGYTTYFRTSADFQFYYGGVHSDTVADPGSGGSNLMTIKSSGNVGINNSNPLYDLHVSGDAAICNGGNSAEAGGTLNFGCAFNLAAGPMASITGRLANWASNATYNTLTGGLAFLTRPLNSASNTSLVEAMRINNAGNVGIGTTTPAFDLDVNGTAQIAPASYTQTPLRVLNSTQSNNNTMGVAFGKALTNYNSGYVNFQHLGTDGAQSNYMSLGLWGTVVTSAPLTMNGYGRVGINTNTPAHNLDVAGGIRGYSLLASSFAAITDPGSYMQWNRDSGGGMSYWINQQGLGAGGHVWGQCTQSNVLTEYMRLTAAGRLGIGTGSPSYPLHVSGTVSGTLTGQYITNTGGVISATSSAQTVSIYASGAMTAVTFFATSDQRIKNNIVDVDSIEALSVIKQLRPKRFGYVDTIQYGSKSTYGFIAQHVESISQISNVVKTTIDIVPNVYDSAIVTDDILYLHRKSTSCLLDDNNHLQVFTTHGEENKIDVTIVDVLDDRRIQIDKRIGDGVVFVYGQRVNDFKIVDKEAIFTVAVSAVQQLEAMVTKLQADNAELRVLVQSLSDKVEKLCVK